MHDMLNLQTQLQVSIHRSSVYPLIHVLQNPSLVKSEKKLEPLGLGGHTPGVVALEKPLRGKTWSGSTRSIFDEL
jgi:hypothetical protein